MEQTVDGSIHQEGIWYRQGDGNPRQHDWFIGATAGGLILESDRLLVRHDVAAARKRLPQLERVAALLDSNYQYLYADLEGALRHLLGKDQAVHAPLAAMFTEADADGQ